jgi:hypothetical protein
MTCSAAVILAALNLAALPPRGSVVTVPAALAEHYTPHQQRAARNCARRYGIELRKGG